MTLVWFRQRWIAFSGRTRGRGGPLRCRPARCRPRADFRIHLPSDHQQVETQLEPQLEPEVTFRLLTRPSSFPSELYLNLAIRGLESQKKR